MAKGCHRYASEPTITGTVGPRQSHPLPTARKQQSEATEVQIRHQVTLRLHTFPEKVEQNPEHCSGRDVGVRS